MEAPNSCKKRTRHTSGTHFSECLGGEQELLPTKVPTLRDILRKGLMIQREMLIMMKVDRRNFKVNEMADQLSDLVIKRWTKANALFKPPVVIAKKSLSKNISKA